MEIETRRVVGFVLSVLGFVIIIWGPGIFSLSMFSITGGGSCTIRVVDEAYHPLDGALVQCKGVVMGGQVYELNFSPITCDMNGEVNPAFSYAGVLLFEVSKEGYVTQTVEADTSIGEEKTVTLKTTGDPGGVYAGLDSQWLFIGGPVLLVGIVLLSDADKIGIQELQKRGFVN